MTYSSHNSTIYSSEPSLIYYGHKTLRLMAQPVTEIEPELEILVDSMFSLMRSSNGIGLAAPQINLPRQIVTVDLESYQLGKLALLNPRVVFLSEEKGPYNEGCLSVPGIYESVIRPLSINVEALDLKGRQIEINADGILARVLQHEIDHLHGILFVDYLEEFLRREYTKELKKIKKLNNGNSKN